MGKSFTVRRTSYPFLATCRTTLSTTPSSECCTQPKPQRCTGVWQARPKSSTSPSILTNVFRSKTRCLLLPLACISISPCLVFGISTSWRKHVTWEMRTTQVRPSTLSFLSCSVKLIANHSLCASQRSTWSFLATSKDTR